VWGPVLGAGVVMALREVLWAEFPALHLALLGVLLLIVVLFLPRGLISLLIRPKRVRPEEAAVGSAVGGEGVESRHPTETDK